MKTLLLSFFMAIALPLASGATFNESFSTEPIVWRSHNPGAVLWNPDAKNLSVTWDSRKTNSFFYYQLPMTLTRRDAFSCELTLTLNDLQIGIDPAKKSTFPLCFGFLNVAQATRANYFRGSGVNAETGPRSVVEFTYFPDAGFGATIGPIIASTNNQIAYSHSFPVELVPGETYQIKLAFDPAAQVLNTTILHNGAPYGEPGSNSIRPVNYTSAFGDFRIDAFSIHSYSDAGQLPPEFAGSLLAHGIVDDVSLTFPDPPIGRIGIRKETFAWVISFEARSGWIYGLERSSNFGAWEEITNENGFNGTLELMDADSPPSAAFYRVRAFRL